MKTNEELRFERGKDWEKTCGIQNVREVLVQRWDFLPFDRGVEVKFLREEHSKEKEQLCKGRQNLPMMKNRFRGD